MELVLVVGSLLAVPAVVVGGLWFWAGRALKKSKAAERERKLLQIVKQKRGRVTDVELALESRATLEQCRQFLKDMVQHGAAQTHIGPEGRMVYVFHDFLTEEQKQAAIDPAQWSSSRAVPPLAETPPPLEQAPSKSGLDLAPRPLELETKPLVLDHRPVDLDR